MLKAYKYRLYPNKQQIEQIQKTFGCCRFVYNQTLAYRKELYETKKESISRIDCNNWKNKFLKVQYEWLKEIDKFALDNAVINMDSAYQKFFKEHNGYPKFKSKRNNKKSYKTNYTNKNIEVSFEKNKIKLPKLKWVKTKVHREFTGKIKSATISQVPSGKYFVSILVETEHIPMKENDNSVGIDLGIKDLLITSDGEKFDNIRTTKKYEDKLAKEQRKLSHKVKCSKNWNKQRIKIARIHEKIHNTRIDNLHKISHQLISENQVIVSEDLAVSNMMKNHNLAKAISDCGWYELTRQLTYKAEWSGRTYIKIGRYVPSSQTCNVCGFVNKDTKSLSVREWICPVCGTVHDRDINAAINILNEGMKMLNVA
ncbi:IS200/IS605 family element RNA-guided endonuclease TnpB [Anaerobutyricum hallii]|uniref:IS200/IS605 family element RNA-guided endonuclease TnpB n=1 Tax=Anaerobutyricum hallii TaxID=39488 RepID=UPI00399D0337